jgi:hypothetical protein
MNVHQSRNYLKLEYQIPKNNYTHKETCSCNYIDRQKTAQHQQEYIIINFATCHR